ncbi:lipoyl synthase [Halodesulfovibrio marinisediminis]|uniref:Lipoyl synthase n=1 Tax=Halodesulfovibrio marinisediminis DSM 17456 TaxID=1121457 RepID=A0A1N6G0E8_9BACT|nr:lipoyl synthase [Halodesulfovibrio marinisediminis]SIO00911.1 lipoic acid synthetase [Halodesulfovibrio marinisediminis DSM 17456]
MCSQKRSEPYLRIPPWLRVKIPCNKTYSATTELVKDLNLNTVCQSAKCPNMFECFTAHTATFLIMGNTCTRNCAFCNISNDPVEKLDADEPARVAEAAKRLGLKHVVITSVTRDDLIDGGAEHFAKTIRAVRNTIPDCSIEVLIPDFQGSKASLQMVIDAQPDIINHNVETPPVHYDDIRPQADYEQSITLLKRVKEAGCRSKSGLMVGLGETDEEVRGVIDDLAAIDCDIVTIGQYMRPSRLHPEVKRYVHPDVFDEYAEYGKSKGVKHMFSAPLVRSSYNAAMFAEEEKNKAVKTAL